MKTMIVVLLGLLTMGGVVQAGGPPLYGPVAIWRAANGGPGVTCGALDSKGNILALPGQMVATQIDGDSSLGPVHVRCQGHQGFRAGSLIRYEGTCSPDAPNAGPYWELITPAGEVFVDCFLRRMGDN